MLFDRVMLHVHFCLSGYTQTVDSVRMVITRLWLQQTLVAFKLDSLTVLQATVIPAGPSLMTIVNGACRVIYVQGVTCILAPGCDIEHFVVSAYSSLESEFQPGMAK